jgi:ERCC4-type nuclease
VFVAPSEGVVMRRLGPSSSLPERYGADVFFVASGRKHGVQRKATGDFVASVMDGRLHREVAQMTRLDVAVLCVEGRFVWTDEGMWAGPSRWDRFRHRQYLFDLQSRGIWTMETDTVNETAEVCRELERWARKVKHSGPDHRPGPVGPWGKLTSKDYACHLLQGIDGIGPELAGRIVDAFGRAPIGWTVPPAEWEVAGIGPERVRKLTEALG